MGCLIDSLIDWLVGKDVLNCDGSMSMCVVVMSLVE